MATPIYCISGLGADEKIFTNLRVNGHELKYIPWIRPLKKETIDSYAKRMGEYIKDDPAILLGVSFGGMLSIEIAKQRKLQKLFIISSVKSFNEMPGWMKTAGSLKLDKIVPVRLFKYTERINNSRIGAVTKEEKEMVKAYRNNADLVFIEWAITQILNWKNNWWPENIIHIHGDQDKIFPIKKVNPSFIINEGTHMMIFNRAAEISEFIQKEL